MEQQQHDRPVRLAELFELDEDERRSGLVHRASSSGARKPTVSQHAGPATVFIQVSATGSGRWTDELGSEYGSVDCAVQLGVGQQQPEVKQEQLVPAARSKARSWIKHWQPAEQLQHQQQRRLQQLPPVQAAPTPQPQQAQAKQHIQRGGQGVAWHLTAAGLDARQAWNGTYGLDEVVVAVVGSGIELSHSGLGPSVWANAGEVAADGIDNDGNGYIDDVMGWDFGGSCADDACSRCTPGPDPSDMAGWGTHAAAVIAAQPEVASGTAGIAPGVRVMALKVADCSSGTQLGDWAVHQGLGSTEGSSSERHLRGHGPAHPVLLASAAVQAFDYALLNGAHVAQQLSSAYTGPLRLKPAQLTTALTAASSSLSYSWHISSAASGPYDTQAMAFVARKALNTSSPFPLSDWEFFGYTSLVEVEGFVAVQNPGNYSLAVSSKDKFVVWLQDKWLAMRAIGEAGPGLGVDAEAWTAGVLFTQPGLYRLRIIIYMPSLSAFDLKWLPPGAAGYSHIPRFLSFGRTQPLPLQLADQISGHMLMHRSSSGSKAVPSSSGGSLISTTLDEPWEYRTIIPSLKSLSLQRTGVLRGPGIAVLNRFELQQQLLGAADAADGRSAYGVVQGWLDWQDLNLAAVEWLQNLSSSSENSSAGSTSDTSGLGLGVGAPVLGSAGVQFELVCGNQDQPHGCTLHIDGLVVAGSIGEPAMSACIVPARRLITSSSSSISEALAEQLLHLELLFATDDLREITFSRVLPQYGPSDIEVKDYSSWLQRQQLASGSTVADPIHWRGPSSGSNPSSSSNVLEPADLSDPAVLAQLGYRPHMLTGGSPFNLGKLTGLYAYAVPAGAGWGQLLVLQAEGLSGAGRLVAVDDVAGAVDLGSSDSGRPFAALKEGWMPGEWDAWLPA
ncbi:hypothetical protein OEZ86_013021 [Tetradesmus obliquus]|nr:hypothetical protein OEZ86_013021 [Tetradesmus obliquus]